VLKRVTFHRFKQFRDHSFDFRPIGVTLIAGGNNSGKSSLLQGLAVWEFSRTALEMERGRKAFLAGVRFQGIGLGDDEFSPIGVPALNHLWTGLGTQRAGEPDGYTLKIRAEWESGGADKHLEFGLALANDRLFVKTTSSNLRVGDEIPRVAYLPPFAGITAHETRIGGATRRRRIGEGLAGAILRNLLLDMQQRNAAERLRLRGSKSKINASDLKILRETDPWEVLQASLRRTFAAELLIAPFSEEYHSYIKVKVAKGVTTGSKLKRHHGYRDRDLMVEGSGFLQWLSVYALATDPTLQVLLLDEPDAHLHTTLQQSLYDDLQGFADQTGKQVLIATHSAELLRNADPDVILEVRQGGRGSRYLTENSQKIGLLAGLGSAYSPRLDRLRQSRRLLFVEGSDLSILRELASHAGVAWPQQWVEWRTTHSHSERRQLFLALQQEIAGLVAYSLRDRDDDVLASVGPNLEETSLTASADFFPRKWRRRYIESYLIWPQALATASGRTLAEVERILADDFALVVTAANFKPTIAPGPLLDVRAKDVLRRVGVTAVQAARAMDPAVIPDDVLTVLSELSAEAT